MVWTSHWLFLWGQLLFIQWHWPRILASHAGLIEGGQSRIHKGLAAGLHLFVPVAQTHCTMRSASYFGQGTIPVYSCWPAKLSAANNWISPSWSETPLDHLLQSHPDWSSFGHQAGSITQLTRCQHHSPPLVLPSRGVFEAEAKASPSADQLTSSSNRPQHEPPARTSRTDLPSPTAAGHKQPEPPLDSPATTRLVFTCPGASTRFTHWSCRVQNSCSSQLAGVWDTAKTSLGPPVVNCESEQPLPPTGPCTTLGFACSALICGSQFSLKLASVHSGPGTPWVIK